MKEAANQSNEAVIELRDVSRNFGSTVAMDHVNFDVPRGSVYGLVGMNGAGKTTLLKHVLGLLEPQTGHVHVFGRDPIMDPENVLSQIGYLSEENDLPGWMRVRELMRYQRAFYSTWDADYAEELRETFDLDPHAKIRSLSRGQRARSGLLVALAHRPSLLVLDEPSSGLDPVVRRDILVAIIRTISDEGRTVLFSSHLLDEVERVSDHVAMIDQGRIVLNGTMKKIKASFHLLVLRCATSRSRPPEISCACGWKRNGNEWSAICEGRLPVIEGAVRSAEADILECRTATLEEVFVARAGIGTGANQEGTS